MLWVIAGKSIRRRFDLIIFFVSHIIFFFGSKVFGLVAEDRHLAGLLFIAYFLGGILTIYCLQFFINLKLLIENRKDFSLVRHIVLALNLFVIVFFLLNIFRTTTFYPLINLMNL